VKARLPGVAQETDLLREIRGAFGVVGPRRRPNQATACLCMAISVCIISPSNQAQCSTTMVRLGQIDTTTSATLFLTNNKRTY
jgi:hypothetical protein